MSNRFDIEDYEDSMAENAEIKQELEMEREIRFYDVNTAICVIRLINRHGVFFFEEMRVIYDTLEDLDTKLGLIAESYEKEALEMEIITIGHNYALKEA